MRSIHDSNHAEEIIEKYKTGKFTCAQLARDYGYAKNSVNKFLRKNGVVINNDPSWFHRIYTLDHTFFDNINTKEKAYYLGWMYSDGYNNKDHNYIQLAVQEGDQDILVKFNELLKSNRPIIIDRLSLKNSNHKDSHRLYVNHPHISNRLSQLGCTQKKSLTLQFPTTDQVPINLIKSFILGYLDGDGCIGSYLCGKSYKYVVSFTSTSSFCQSMSEIIQKELNIKPSIFHKKTDGPITWNLRIAGKNTLTFLDWLYADATIYLERKYKKYQEIQSLILGSQTSISV